MPDEAKHIPDLPEGWSLPEPQHMPRPTWAPAEVSFGATFMLWGIVTSIFITAVGTVVFIWGIARWIGDIRNERKML